MKQHHRGRGAISGRCNCAGVLRDKFAGEGIEVTVLTVPPLVQGPYTIAHFTCTHGGRYWPEPTGEQIAQWAADGVR